MRFKVCGTAAKTVLYLVYIKLINVFKLFEKSYRQTNIMTEFSTCSTYGRVEKGRHDGTAVIWRNIWLDLGGKKCQIEIKFIKLKPTKVQVDPSKIRTSSSRINFIILCNLGMVWKFYFIYLNGKKPKKNLASEDMCRPVFTGQNNSLHYILHISLNNCLYNSPHYSLQNSLHNSLHNSLTKYPI